MAFSLVELLISLSILATVILIVVGLFLSAIQTSKKSTDLSSAALVARSIISQEMNKVRTGASSTTLADLFDSTPFSISGETKVGHQNFDFELTRELLNHRDSGDPVGQRLANNRLVKVNVLVKWTGNDDLGSPGQGMQRVKYSELFNERELL